MIGTIYRHPSSNTKDFIEFFNDILSELIALKVYYFILGDININTKARFTQTALAENRVSGKRQDPGMSHRKLQAFAERVSGNFLRPKPQAAELK